MQDGPSNFGTGGMFRDQEFSISNLEEIPIMHCE